MSITRSHLLLAALISLAMAYSDSSSAQDALTLEQMLTKEEQAKLGTSSMSPEKRDAMQGALVRMFRQGHRAGQATDRISSPSGRSVVETQIDGEFNGWEGETIIKLMNGQIWQQTEYHYEYRYAYMPKVLVYPSGGGYKIRVEGTSKPIGVQRLR
jgi:hypothetical protein